MKTLTTLLFLIFFILTGVLIVGNITYVAEEFFFLATFQEKSLGYPFLGFAFLGMMTGIFLILSLRYMFAKEDKNIDLDDDMQL